MKSFPPGITHVNADNSPVHVTVLLIESTDGDTCLSSNPCHVQTTSIPGFVDLGTLFRRSEGLIVQPFHVDHEAGSVLHCFNGKQEATDKPFDGDFSCQKHRVICRC